MNITRISAIVVRQLFLLRHNLTRLANIFIWIILDIVLWGFITRYLNEVGGATFSFVPTLLGAVVLWDFMIRIQQGVMLAFFEDVWSRNFLNLFASPLKTREYVTGLVATSVLTGSAGMLVMLLLAGAVFGYHIFMLGSYLFFLLLILFLFGLALGIFAAGVVLEFGPSAEWFAWPIPFLLAPFLGIYYPISTLPAAFQSISAILPPAYAFEGMRSVLFSGTFVVRDAWVGVGLGVVYLLLAYAFFLFVYRHVLRTGLISRFTAEGE